MLLGLGLCIWFVLMFLYPAWVLNDDEATIRKQSVAMICICFFFISAVALICVMA